MSKHIRTDKDLIKRPSEGKMAEMGGREEFGKLHRFFHSDIIQLLEEINLAFDSWAEDLDHERRIEYENFYETPDGYFNYVCRVRIVADFTPRPEEPEQTKLG